jgi:hypothetical protein
LPNFVALSQLFLSGCSALSRRYPEDPYFSSQKITEHILYGNYLKNDYTLDQIDTMLTSTSYPNRAIAALVLGYGHVADTARCLEMLVKSLENEIYHPFSNEYAVEVSESVTDFLKGQYMVAFRYLLYKNGFKLLRPYIEKSHGDLKSMLIIIAGFTGEKCVRKDIREICLENTNGYLRIQASHVMNIFPDRPDIPVLIKALKDDYHTTDRFGNKTAGVAINAGCALLRMGYTLDEIEGMRNNDD